MRKVSSRSSRRRRATFVLGAIAAAAALGAGAALAHDEVGSVDQTAKRGFKGISNVDHGARPAGLWTFTVVEMDGKVMDLTLAIKSECVGGTGTFEFYEQIKKPELNLEVTTVELPLVSVCSQVAFPGAGKSITVRVTHP